MQQHRFVWITGMSDEQISAVLNEAEEYGWQLIGSLFDLKEGCRLVFAKDAGPITTVP